MSSPREHTRSAHASKVAERRTVVLKGLDKHVAMSSVCRVLENAGSLSEVQRVRKTAFATFSTAAQAACAVERLNNCQMQGKQLQVFLLGGPGWAGPSSSPTAIESKDPVARSAPHASTEAADATQASSLVDTGRGGTATTSAAAVDPDAETGPRLCESAVYRHHSQQAAAAPVATVGAALRTRRQQYMPDVLADEATLPWDEVGDDPVEPDCACAVAPRQDEGQHSSKAAGFTGLYLTRLLRLWRQRRHRNDSLALLSCLTAPRSNQTKELCESLGVVQALFDFAHARQVDLRQRRALVFVPGDGRRPSTAAALSLQVRVYECAYSCACACVRACA